MATRFGQEPTTISRFGERVERISAPNIVYHFAPFLAPPHNRHRIAKFLLFDYNSIGGYL